jgi:hypothetical protein
MVLFPKNPPHPFCFHSTCRMQCISVQQCLSSPSVLMYDMSVIFQLMAHATYPIHTNSSTYTQTHSTQIIHYTLHCPRSVNNVQHNFGYLTFLILYVYQLRLMLIVTFSCKHFWMGWECAHSLQHSYC